MIYTRELYAFLDAHCEEVGGEHRCQTISSIRPPSLWKQVEEVDFTIAQPFWGQLHHVPVRSPGDFRSQSPGKLSWQQHTSIVEKTAAAAFVVGRCRYG
jgi:hypothetical protein